MKNCNPFDYNDDYGDNWNHMVYDPKHLLILSVISGKTTNENTHNLGKI